MKKVGIYFCAIMNVIMNQYKRHMIQASDLAVAVGPSQSGSQSHRYRSSSGFSFMLAQTLSVDLFVCVYVCKTVGLLKINNWYQVALPWEA